MVSHFSTFWSPDVASKGFLSLRPNIVAIDINDLDFLGGGSAVLSSDRFFGSLWFFGCFDVVAVVVFCVVFLLHGGILLRGI